VINHYHWHRLIKNSVENQNIGERVIITEENMDISQVYAYDRC